MTEDDAAPLQLVLLETPARCELCADREWVAVSITTHAGALGVRLDPCPFCTTPRDLNPR